MKAFFAAILIAFVATSAYAVVSVAADCKTLAPAKIVSSSKDKAGITWLYTFVSDPKISGCLSWLKSNYDHKFAEISKRNEDKFCPAFKEAASVMDKGDINRAKGALANLLQGVRNRKKAEKILRAVRSKESEGGEGLKFSDDPLSLYEAGSQMVAVAIPAGKEYGLFMTQEESDGYLQSNRLFKLIMSKHTGIVYQLKNKHVMFSMRDSDAITGSDGKLNCWYFPVSNGKAGREMWKIDPYVERHDSTQQGFGVVAHFHDWLGFAHEHIKSILSSHSVSDEMVKLMILYQIQNKFGGSAMGQPGGTDMDAQSHLVYYLDPHTPPAVVPKLDEAMWKRMLAVLAQQEYLDRGDAAKLRVNDREGLFKELIHAFNYKGGRKTAQSFVDGLKKLYRDAKKNGILAAWQKKK